MGAIALPSKPIMNQLEYTAIYISYTQTLMCVLHCGIDIREHGQTRSKEKSTVEKQGTIELVVLPNHIHSNGKSGPEVRVNQ